MLSGTMEERMPERIHEVAQSLLQEAGNAPFCRLQEKFHTVVVLRGVRKHISETPVKFLMYRYMWLIFRLLRPADGVAGGVQALLRLRCRILQ